MAVLERWAYVAEVATAEVILPDGCRDVIVIFEEGVARCFLSELQDGPRLAEIEAGQRMEGFRMRPGALVDMERIERGLQDGLEDVAGLVAENSAVCVDVEDALGLLAFAAPSVACVAAELGVSVRTLQRVFARRGLPPPEFWLLLARARRAAGLIGGAPLADVAYGAGYADQAHMTREFRRWFGAAPARFARDAGMLEAVRQSGFGGATGEQISTR